MAKSLKEKQDAYERRLKHLQELHGIKVSEAKTIAIEQKAVEQKNVSAVTKEDLEMTSYFRVDLRRSLVFIVGIFTLEFLWYFASMNNYLSKLIKF